MTTLDPEVNLIPAVKRRSVSPLWRVFKWLQFAFGRLSRNPPALFGTLMVILFLFVAVFAPFIAPYSFTEQINGQKLKPPTADFIFGTDNLGRDIFSRVLWGSRELIALAGSGTLIALLVGTLIGLFVAYRGGLFDEFVFRIMDSLLALPASLLALLILGALGPQRESVIPVLVIVYVPIVARVVRSVVLDVKTKGFIEAAKMRGESSTYILFREIFPSVLPALVVEGSLRFAYAIFLVATLGFLGIGVQPPSPDWGLQVAQAKNYGALAPWMLFYPCAAIALLVVSVNLMADGLKQIFQSTSRD